LFGKEVKNLEKIGDQLLEFVASIDILSSKGKLKNSKFKNILSTQDTLYDTF
jgi:hypothetical protein